MKRFLLSITFIVVMITIMAKTPIDGIIDKVRTQYVPDKRVSIYEVEASRQSNGAVQLTGKISDPKAFQALDKSVKSQRLVPVVNETELLPQNDFGLINLSVASVRTSPKYSSELSTQTLMGMPVRLLEEKDGWWRIQCPDNYIGWVWGASITPKTEEEMEQWRNTPRLVVTSLYETQAYDAPDTQSPRHRVTDLVPGNIVEGDISKAINGKVEITLPDGRKAWADASALTSIEQWAAQEFDPRVILDTAYSMEGAPYLWGGTSPKATDCSGLVKVAYLANGYILSRDASQQATTGTKLASEDWKNYKPGDLLFFGEKPGGRVTHVGIYDSDGNFVHCAGRVHRSSLDPKSPLYNERLFFGGARMQGNEDTPGITLARNHPWIFNN